MGALTTNETWSGTITISGDVTVPSGITLTIQPGTIVQFSPGQGLELIIEGSLRAEGEVNQPIRLKINMISYKLPWKIRYIMRILKANSASKKKN